MTSEVAEVVAELEKEVFSLTKENELQNRVFSKFEETLEKIQILTETLHRLIVQHEERIRVNADSVETLRRDMSTEIKELEERLAHETNNLCVKIEKSEERILEKLAELRKEWNDKIQKKTNDPLVQLASKFSSFKWFIFGGIFVAAYFMGHLNIIGLLIKVAQIP